MANFLKRIMTSLFELVAGVLSGQAAEIAALRNQLAEAKADDADAAAAAAEAAASAEAAAGKIAELQALADADVTEDQQIRDLLAAYQPVPEAAPEPVVEPVAEAEVEPETVEEIVEE